MLLLVGDYPVRQLVLYEKILVGRLSGSWTQMCWDGFG
jgi:hypothetical protein